MQDRDKKLLPVVDSYVSVVNTKDGTYATHLTIYTTTKNWAISFFES